MSNKCITCGCNLGGQTVHCPNGCEVTTHKQQIDIITAERDKLEQVVEAIRNHLNSNQAHCETCDNGCPALDDKHCPGSRYGDALIEWATAQQDMTNE
jgi:hypothetical protein